MSKIKWLAVTVGVLVIVALIVLGTAPLMSYTCAESVPYMATETYYEKEPYTIEETYYEKEPYNVQETYYEKELYTVYEDISYRVVDTDISNWFWSIGSDCSITIRNADTVSGYFWVTFHLVTRGGAKLDKQRAKYIALATEETITVKHSGDYIHTFTYSINPPDKEVTKYRDVLKTRQVVRYKDEYRTEKLTVLEYLTR